MVDANAANGDGVMRCSGVRRSEKIVRKKIKKKRRKKREKGSKLRR